MAFLPRTWAPLLALIAFVLFLADPIVAVKHENFKTCAQSGFCARNRHYAYEAAQAGSGWSSPYVLDPSTISLKNGLLTGTVLKTVNEAGETVRLPLTISFLQSGAARVQIDEERRLKGDIELRHDRKIRKERYNEAEKWTIVGGLAPNKDAKLSDDRGFTSVKYGDKDSHEAIIQHSPFAIDFKRSGETQVKFNGRGLLNVEHWRAKVEPPPTPEGEEAKEPAKQPHEDTWWDETFGGATDSKPRGPESVAIDVTFPGYEHVYGIPEHTGPMSLKETRGGDGKFTDPYRLHNSDVFEYIMDSPMTLYGSIPFMQAKRKGSTVGVFWLNAAETWIDITKSRASANPLSMGISAKTDTSSHWISESGVLDVFVFLGPSPAEMSKMYAELTGYTQLPQHFAIAYHQCRWNYVTDEDVKDVDRKFDKHSIPYDIIWLDLEYLDDRKYFTWDPLTFPDPVGMQQQLDDTERKLVVLIDPHVKKTDGYWVYKELTDKDLAVKNKEGENYEGWCWPGASHWIDCFNPAAVEWTKSVYRYDRFTGSKDNLFIWNDMNEPSVFNGPETTMPKDNVHFGGWEHRDIHNLNGLTFVNATFAAMQVRDDPRGKTRTKRPFILTRSFYAGSQRMGAMWTGDNQAEWPHLAASIPMVLNNGIAGFPFAGADVGGFFGNTEKDLLARWYQAGAFYPFFRGHAHIDTRRREPYLLPSPQREIITQALNLRYSLLTSWYTAFFDSSTTGAPIVRPMWWVHPDDDAGFGIDDQLYLGTSGLLVKPVVTQGAEHVDVYLPNEESGRNVPYYDYATLQPYSGAGRTHRIAAPLDKIPILMRAGHILTRRDRPRRSSALMRWDPITLVVALDPADATGGARGELYMDDGETYEYESGAYIHRQFSFSGHTLGSADLSRHGDRDKQKTKAARAYLERLARVDVDRIVLVGVPESWAGKTQATATLADGTEHRVDVTVVAASKTQAAHAVVRKPGLAIASDWSLSFA